MIWNNINPLDGSCRLRGLFATADLFLFVFGVYVHDTLVLCFFFLCCSCCFAFFVAKLMLFIFVGFFCYVLAVLLCSLCGFFAAVALFFCVCGLCIWCLGIALFFLCCCCFFCEVLVLFFCVVGVDFVVCTLEIVPTLGFCCPVGATDLGFCFLLVFACVRVI